MPRTKDPRSLFRRAYQLARRIRKLGLSTGVLSRVERDECQEMLAACGDAYARAAMRAMITRVIVSRHESAVRYWLMMRKRPTAEGYREAHGPPGHGAFPLPYE